MITVIMPQVGHDVPSAEIIEWRKAEGDPVEEGEVVVVVESEKAIFEVEAEAGGVVRRILHGEGEEVEVFAPIGYIGGADEPIPDRPESPAEGEPAATAEASEPAERTTTPSEPGEAGRTVASPSARRVAGERGVALSAIEGSGPGGRVIKRDVLEATPTAGDREVPFGKARRRIAERLTGSARNIPHFYLSTDVDVTEAQAWRRRRNAAGEVHLTVTDLVIRAAAVTLRGYERLNAHVAEDRLTVKADVNVGVAVATEGGLLVPVIPLADRKSVEQISELSRRNAEAARRGALRSDADGSFTVSSLGMFGIREFLPIINPPECAILAVGAAEERVVPFEGGTAVREIMTLTLGCDHRAVDGTYAARFVKNLKNRLESMNTTESRT